MIKRILFLFLSALILITSSPVYAKDPSLLTEKELDKEIEDYIAIAKDTTAAVSIGIIKDGKVIYKNNYGYIDLENKVENSDEAVFEWASVTKTLVWISLVQLEEKGLVDFDEDIRTYLPDDFPLKTRFDEPITIMNLFNHNAGFQETIYKTEYKPGEKIPNLEEAMAYTSPIQVNKAGEVVAYSNWGASLGAIIVEEVTGQDFNEYVNENIFKPLDMDHTSILPDWSDNEYVQENRPKTKSYSLNEVEDLSLGTSLSHISLYPAGAGAGSLDDLMKLVSEFTKDESILFENPESLDKFRTPSLTYTDSDLGRIYHGLWSLDYGQKVIGHAGNSQGYSSAFWFEPESKTAVCIMTNEVGETFYNYGLLKLLYGDYEGNEVEADGMLQGFII